MTRPRSNPWLDRSPLRIAHQGGEAEAPSSTMYALQRAVGLGVDALELDVHATADGHLVVLHDPTVDRTTNGRGAVADMTLGQVRQFDAAHWFVPGVGVAHGRGAQDYPLRGIATGAKQPPPGFTAADFTIPALADVFAAFPDTLINLDIKATAPQVKPYEQTLADLIATYDRSDITMVASFSDAALRSYRSWAPEGWTSASPEEVLRFWQAVNEGRPIETGVPYSALQVPDVYGDVAVVSEPFVAAAHSDGLAVHVWTIDDPLTMRRLLDLGVDGVVTNRPTVLLELLAH